MKYCIFLLIFIYACGTGKQLTYDYTANKSRTSTTSKALQVHTEISDSREIIAKTAIDQVGKKYQYGKCGPHAFDCSGLTQYIYAGEGIQLPRTSVDQAKHGRQLKSGDIEKGDLVIFQKGTKVSHVGICVEREKGELWVVHSTSSNGVIMENVLDSPYWSRRVKGGRRVIQ